MRWMKHIHATQSWLVSWHYSLPLASWRRCHHVWTHRKTRLYEQEKRKKYPDDNMFQSDNNSFSSRDKCASNHQFLHRDCKGNKCRMAVALSRQILCKPSRRYRQIATDDLNWENRDKEVNNDRGNFLGHAIHAYTRVFALADDWLSQ